MRADAILKVGAKESRDAIEATRRGLGAAKVDELVKCGRVSLAEIDRIVPPRKSLSHRRKIGVLTPEQSDRLIRLVRVTAAAEETFGSQEKAARRLRRPTTALMGESSISLLDTGEGSRQVEHLPVMIDHGLAARCSLGVASAGPSPIFPENAPDCMVGVIVPKSVNILINVAHPDAKRVAIDSKRAFSFDERLWRQG